MHKKLSAALSLLLPLVFASAATGCMVEDDMVAEEETADEQAETHQPGGLIAADELAELEAEAEEGDGERPGKIFIQLGEMNGICAQTLSVRNLPGGDWNMCEMRRGDHVRPYHTNGGEWAYHSVWTGPCAGHAGWSLKDYISRRCL